jgi:hypothetical protein
MASEPINKTKDEYEKWWWGQWKNDAFVEEFKETNEPMSPGELIVGDTYLIIGMQTRARRAHDPPQNTAVVGILNGSLSHDPCVPYTQQSKLTFSNTVALSDHDDYKKLEKWTNRSPEEGHKSYMRLRKPRQGSWVLVEAPPRVRTLAHCNQIRDFIVNRPLEIYSLKTTLDKMRQRYEELSARVAVVRLASRIPDDVIHDNVMPFLKRKGGRKSTTRKRKKSRRRKTKRRKTKRRKTKRRKTKRKI